jgi:hypothetical protein
MPRAILFLTALVPWFLATTAQAQARRPADAEPPAAIVRPSSHPLDSKQRAKAEWQVQQTDIKELMRSRARAAWLTFQEQLDWFLSGRGTLAFELDAVAKWRDAGLAVAENDRERLAILEHAWRVLQLMDDCNRRRLENARINYVDWFPCRHARLTQEIELCRAQRTAQATPVPLPLSRSRKAELDTTALLFSKQVAREKFDAVRADPKQLALARLQPAEDCALSRQANLMCGRGTLEFTLQAWGRLLQARLAVMDNEADRRAAIEQYWQVTTELDDIDQARYEAGRISLQDLMRAHEARLTAEYLLHSNRKHTDKQATRVPLRYERWCLGDEANPKALARAKFEAWHAEPRALLRSRRDALQVEVREREKEFFEGRGTLTFFLGAARRLLEAELAFAENDAALIAARRSYWQRLKMIVDISKGFYDSGRVDLAFYAETARDLRNAEIELLQAWQKK